MDEKFDCPRRRTADKPELRVYVAKHCGSCYESRRLAKVIRARLTDITVEVVDIDHQEPVDEIFAVPTFCYRGKILFLGNPREDELIAHLLTLERDALGSALPCTEHERSDLPAQGTVSPFELEAVAISHRENLGHKNTLIVASSGALGLVGSLFCSLTMVAPALGLIALPATRSSMPGMSNSSSGQAQLPGWWTNLAHLGPQILVLSVLLVVLATSVRRRFTMVPAGIGGLVLYLGMYAQPRLMGMEVATVIGTGLLVLAYAASLRPTLGLATVRLSR